KRTKTRFDVMDVPRIDQENEETSFQISWMRLFVAAGLLIGLTACSTRPPAQPENLCQIFREKPDWHKAALKMNEKWGTPVQVVMAMMYQESSFVHDAQPPMGYFLFIPTGRASSAYGY
ncbi:transglycosylase SLT domain-containing protein, partial [Escherichia coli]